MSILVRNMEMPTGCDKCPFEYFGDCYGGKIKYIMDIDEEIADGVRHKDCPLIEVPPHGRLIDADALKEKMKIVTRTAVQEIIEYDINAYKVDDAPTIIPAEGGET